MSDSDTLSDFDHYYVESLRIELRSQKLLTDTLSRFLKRSRERNKKLTDELAKANLFIEEQGQQLLRARKRLERARAACAELEPGDRGPELDL